MAAAILVAFAAATAAAFLRGRRCCSMPSIHTGRGSGAGRNGGQIMGAGSPSPSSSPQPSPAAASSPPAPPPTKKSRLPPPPSASTEDSGNTSGTEDSDKAEKVPSGPNPYASLLRSRCNSPALEKVECHLENRDLWERFNELGTEMIITKTGSARDVNIKVELDGSYLLSGGIYSRLVHLTAADTIAHSARRDRQ
ncbi:T-box transcription factor TBX20-like [Tropilaelaps mercedesae]|uniref:T-box transcription factor TBX20-like n=1 Tax=Tropilaelaps mercedesae TaxID=418985 RepID=A0A1V9XND6_9ACAR|nr:T-box transcription factor TBX20-like [Tropilaelaps mercedesae]